MEVVISEMSHMLLEIVCSTSNSE